MDTGKKTICFDKMKKHAIQNHVEVCLEILDENALRIPDSVYINLCDELKHIYEWNKEEIQKIQ